MPDSDLLARPVLLTMSGVLDPDRRDGVEAGTRPRADYDEMAVALDADLLDRSSARREFGRLGGVLGRLFGLDVLMALACFRRRRRHQVVFTDGEQVGLPYAAFCRFARRRPRHVMIGHRLSTPSKARLQRLLRLRSRVDLVIVYASSQRRFLVEQLGYPPGRVVLHPFMVDTRFWNLDRVTPTPKTRPVVCAVGQERRDYPTLVAAVRELDADVVIAAASPWSRAEDTSAGLDIPPNVIVRPCGHFELRQLYADSTLVVVPLQETDFQAGITTILEAMSMGRVVVCTRTEGQTDTIVDGENGRYVRAGDPEALKRTMEELLADGIARARLAEAGQRWVRAAADVEVYAAELALLARRAPAGR